MGALSASHAVMGLCLLAMLCTYTVLIQLFIDTDSILCSCALVYGTLSSEDKRSQ